MAAPRQFMALLPLLLLLLRAQSASGARYLRFRNTTSKHAVVAPVRRAPGDGTAGSIVPSLASRSRLWYSNTLTKVPALPTLGPRQVPGAVALRDRQLEILAAACATCQSNLRIPVGFEVETADGPCTANFCTWDCENCVDTGGIFGKRKICSPFQCSGTSAQECGETCVEVPTGVDVDWEEMNVCDAAMELPATVGADTALENVADAINNAYALCPCYGKIPEYLSTFSLADFRTAAVSGAAELYTCLLNEVCA